MKVTIQLILATMMCTAGVVIVVICIQIDPEGEVHESILVALGEILTFAGSVIGVDYHYRVKNNNPQN